MAKVHDWKPDGLPPLDWQPADLPDYLDKVYQHVVDKTTAAQEWYFQKKNSKRVLGFVLRVVAIVSATAAGILPVLSEIFETERGDPRVSPGWATILLAVTGLCIMLDKFGGYTSGWVRYVLTAQQIGEHLVEFQFDWQRSKLGLDGQKPTNEQAMQMLTLCRDFTDKVSGLVAEETKQWAGEFESALKLIESAAKDIPKPEPTGALDIKVTNGEKCDGHWKLQIDDAAPQERTGQRAALRGLRPGLHVIRVTAQIGGKSVADEKSAKVIAGDIAEVELELKERT